MKLFNDDPKRRVNIDLRGQRGPHIQITGVGSAVFEDIWLVKIRPFVSAFNLRLGKDDDPDSPAADMADAEKADSEAPSGVPAVEKEEPPASKPRTTRKRVKPAPPAE